MGGKGQYTLIHKNVKIYPNVIVKKYRYFVLFLCLLYVILKLYYCVVPTQVDTVLNENVSEMQTVNSDIIRQPIKNVSVTENDIVKNSSDFSEKQTVTYIYNSSVSKKLVVKKLNVSSVNEKQKVTNINVSSVNEKQKVTNSNVSSATEKQKVTNINVSSVNEKQKVTNINVSVSVNENQAARNSSVVKKQTVNIGNTEKSSTVTITSVTKKLLNKATNTKSVIVNKSSDKPPAKIKAIQKSKVKNTRNKKPKEKLPDISCHYSIQNDTLPSVEDSSFSPGYQPIFFHETSCRGGINNRQACAIESAARLHPKRQINLLFSAPITEFGLNNSNLIHILKIKNINILRLHIEQYTNGTVVDSLFKTQIKKSSYPVEHIADILRIVTLNKYGGVYLDTDSFLVKNLDSLPPNWIAEESTNTLSSGAIGFSIDDFGHNLTTAILKEVRKTYNPKSWTNNGPRAIQRVLERICRKTVKTSGDCKGLKIFPSKDFYPVHYRQNNRYFKKGKMDTLYGSYMHHMWNHLTINKKIEKGSPYATLAEKLCPTIFATYGKEFGQ